MKPTKQQLCIKCISILLTLVLVRIAQAEPFQFAVFGDNRAGAHQYSETPELQSPRFGGLVTDMVDARPDFVIGLGDFISGYVASGKPVKSDVRSSTAQLVLEYDHYLSALKPFRQATIPIYNVPGNHDIFGWKVAQNLFTERLGPLHQSFDHRGSHFVLLNTEEVGQQSGRISRISPAQFAWLEKDLRNSKNARYRFIFMHRPVFSSRKQPHYPLAEQDRRRLHNIFVTYNVRMVFGGHEHTYNHQQHDGIDYYITGLAGVGYDKEGNTNYLLVKAGDNRVTAELRKSKRKGLPKTPRKTPGNRSIAAERIPASDTGRIKYKGEWSFEKVPHLQSITGMPGWMVSNKPGSTATCEFEGTSVSVILAVRYENGIVAVSVDGEKPISISGFGRGTRAGGYLDSASVNYREVPLVVDVKPGKHTLVLRLTDQHDKERYPTPNHLGPTPPPEVRLLAIRTGKFSFATFAGVVRNTHSVRLGRVKIHLKGILGEYAATTGDDGNYSISGIPAGRYTVNVNGAGFEPVTDTVDLVVGKSTKSEYRLPSGSKHPLYGKIFYPSSGVPAIIEAGKSVTIECDAKNDVSDWKTSLMLPDSFSISLDSRPKYIGENQWRLTMTIPAEVRDGLYDLCLTSTAGRHVQHRAIKVVRRFKADFSFVVMDSIEEDYKTLRKIIDRLNQVKPEFVLFTGDNVANPMNPRIAAGKFNRLMNELRPLRVPSFLVPGNHDLGAAGEVQIYPTWQRYIGKLYYSFQYGRCHFVGINNGAYQVLRPEMCDPEQIDWIKNDLARHQDDLLRFTFRHIVLVGYTPTWWPKWENKTCNVNMALYGHYAQNSVMTRGKTVYVQTADVRKHGWYRLVHVRNGRIIRFDPPQTIAGSLSHDGT